MRALVEVKIGNAKNLVPLPVWSSLSKLIADYPASRVLEIDPSLSSGDDFCASYGIPSTNGLNCVVVAGSRGSDNVIAACMAPVGAKLDLNGAVRRALNMRKVRMLDKEKLLADTGMEYGSVTPVGLPPGWRVLLPPSVGHLDYVVVGGGLRVSKLKLPPAALLGLPDAVVVQNMVLDSPA